MKKIAFLITITLMVFAANNVFAQVKVAVGKQNIKVPGKKVGNNINSGMGQFNYYAEINAKTFTFSMEQLGSDKKTETLTINILKVSEMRNSEAETAEQEMGENIPKMYVVTVQGAIVSNMASEVIKSKKYFSYSSDTKEMMAGQMSVAFNNKADADKFCADINKILKGKK